MSNIIVDRRLWLTAGGELVEDGDPSAAFLWAGAGAEVSQEDAEAVGYQPSDGSEGGDEADPDDEDTPTEDSSQDATVDEDELEDDTCAGTTASGDPCSKPAGDDGYCYLHRE